MNSASDRLTSSSPTRPKIATRGKLKRRSETSEVPIELVPAELKLKSILVPVDFSAPSSKAIAYAVPFAKQCGAKLILLHVVEPLPTPDFANSFPLALENDEVTAACEERLQQIINKQEIDPTLVGKAVVRFGRSFNEITDVARRLKTDLIIISTHGYTGLKHTLLGSTAERVVRHAPCPVLIVRQGKHQFV